MKVETYTEDYDNKQYIFVKIDNGKGLIVTLCNLGAQIYSILHRDKESNKYEEITLNQKTVEQMLNRKINPNFGKTCGRTSGRIKDAKL